MNTPSPLVPQGSLLEQKAKSKPHLRIAAFIVALHVVFLGGLLMQGCKREQPPVQGGVPAATNDYATLPPPDTNFLANLPPLDPNLPSAIAPSPTNVPPLDASASTSGLPPMASAPDPSPGLGGAQPGGIAVEPPASVGTSDYTILKGDSFYSVAKKFKVPMNAIAKLNPDVNPSRLRVGQKIQVPAGSGTGPAGAPVAGGGVGEPAIHQVKGGETLTRIAREHGTTVKALRSLNGLKTDRLLVGQKLKVPAAKMPAMSTEPPPPAAVAPAAGSAQPPGAGGGSAPLGNLPPLQPPTQ